MRFSHSYASSLDVFFGSPGPEWMQVSRLIHILLHPAVFFCLAILVIFGSGRYQPLFEEIGDPLGFFLGVIAGVVIYYGSLTLTSLRLPSAGTYLRGVKRAFVNSRPPLSRMIILGGRAVYEEAFWRGTLQVLLGSNVFALFVTALFFTMRHIYLYRKIRCLTIPLALEFFIFSFILGVLYNLSSRIMLVIAVHFVRNILISAGCSFPTDNLAPPDWPNS
jgi:membrane protease YdiL (CAAX protease family)